MEEPKVYPMIAWGFAYREARKGNWEQCARDRERFERRINNVKLILDPVLLKRKKSIKNTN